MTRTIWWEDNQVKMIDQRILPLQYEILSYDDFRAVAEAITDMVVRGAPAIGAAGGFGMALAALQSPARDRDSLLRDLARGQSRAGRGPAHRGQPELGDDADHGRRAAVMCQAPRSAWHTADDIRSAILAEAQRIADEDVEINRRMGAFGAAIVPR